MQIEITPTLIEGFKVLQRQKEMTPEDKAFRCSLRGKNEADLDAITAMIQELYALLHERLRVETLRQASKEFPPEPVVPGTSGSFAKG